MATHGPRMANNRVSRPLFLPYSDPILSMPIAWHRATSYHAGMTLDHTDDWRKRPRKPPALVRDHKLTLRCTAAELEALRQGAVDAGLTLTDHILQRALAVRKRRK